MVPFGPGALVVDLVVMDEQVQDPAGAPDGPPVL